MTGLWGAATVGGRFLTPALSPSGLAGARFALAVPVLALLAWATPHGVRAAALTPGVFSPLAALALIVLLPDLQLAGCGR